MRILNKCFQQFPFRVGVLNKSIMQYDENFVRCFWILHIGAFVLSVLFNICSLYYHLIMSNHIIY
ncbi:hypothetical protein Lalb_Chr16g0387161 [Lupinus albus]|uniref:Uncharacterized protein n=1 Tax=Lupinus albus TaxID=3870 RepID=A0A6A4P6S3_LUPAL|nr:hypothetical protein Lalb_Chr16g0387161 [Lupinus albus]